MTLKMRIRPIAGYFLREECMFRVIWVALAAVTLSLYFSLASTFAQGPGKAQKGFGVCENERTHKGGIGIMACGLFWRIIAGGGKKGRYG
jgi:hypothetical protein